MSGGNLRGAKKVDLDRMGASNVLVAGALNRTDGT